jgi:hypothetical protein
LTFHVCFFSTLMSFLECHTAKQSQYFVTPFQWIIYQRFTAELCIVSIHTQFDDQSTVCSDSSLGQS